MRFIKITLISLLFIPVIALSQSKLQLNDGTKKEIVHKVASIVTEKYVFESIGQNMADYIMKQHEKGEYDPFTKLNPFCKQLTDDLRKISKDKHLYVFYSPEEALEIRARKNTTSKEELDKINKVLYEI